MIALGSDHGGYLLKEEIKNYLNDKGIEYIDFGTDSPQSCSYVDMSLKPCKAVQSGECNLALLFCGTGIGISIAANKHKGIRAAVCSDYFSAKYTRLHNNANVLCLGGRVVGVGLATELVEVFLNTQFEGGRHQTRIAQLEGIDG